MDAPTRIAYWTRVLVETDRLGEEFLSMANDENVTSYIKPFVF
jgi:hypothetical protein